MKRFALVFVAACGRIDFMPVPSMIDASTDAHAVDCTIDPDGTSCDDRNICTASSFCQAGTCVAATPQASCTVADSTNDFAVTQGVNGWYYGFWEAEGDPTYDPTTDFELGTYLAASFVWLPTTGGNYIYLASWGAHPRFGPLRIPVRRWVSTVEGPAIVKPHLRKSDTNCGDGVEMRLVVDGDELWARSVPFDDTVGVDGAVPVELSIGTRIELHLRPNADDSCDTTDTTLTITSL